MKTDAKLWSNTLAQRLLFAVLVCFAFLIQVLFLANMVRWTSAPDRGWIYTGALGPRIIAITRPLGEEAGLRKGDRILAINNQESFATLDELNALIDYEIGHVNEY